MQLFQIISVFLLSFSIFNSVNAIMNSKLYTDVQIYQGNGQTQEKGRKAVIPNLTGSQTAFIYVGFSGITDVVEIQFLDNTGNIQNSLQIMDASIGYIESIDACRISKSKFVITICGKTQGGTIHDMNIYSALIVDGALAGLGLKAISSAPRQTERPTCAFLKNANNHDIVIFAYESYQMEFYDSSLIVGGVKGIFMTVGYFGNDSLTMTTYPADVSGRSIQVTKANVNAMDYATGVQAMPSIARISDSLFVVAWKGQSQDFVSQDTVRRQLPPVYQGIHTKIFQWDFTLMNSLPINESYTTNPHLVYNSNEATFPIVKGHLGTGYKIVFMKLHATPGYEIIYQIHGLSMGAATLEVSSIGLATNLDYISIQELGSKVAIGYSTYVDITSTQSGFLKIIDSTGSVTHSETVLASNTIVYEPLMAITHENQDVGLFFYFDGVDKLFVTAYYISITSIETCGTLLVSQDLACDICHSYDSSEPDGCQFCKGTTPAQRQSRMNSFSGTCICNDGFYDDGSIDCQTCLPQCTKCDDGLECTQCTKTLNRVAAPSTCGCAPGYYENTNFDCVLCVSPCETCSSISFCFGCVSNYFHDGVSVCDLCVNWKPNCATCSNYQTCSTCNDGYYLSGTSCAICVFPCLACTSAIECTLCVTSSPPRILSECSCPVTGYYDDGASPVCQQCTPPCESCQAPGDFCLTCILPYFHNGLSTCDTCANWKPNCATCFNFQSCKFCDEGYYLSGTSCAICVFPCVFCSSAIDCTSCVSSSPLRILNDCSCPISGFYDDGTTDQCQACTSPCDQCETMPTKCITCIANNYINGTSVCDTCANWKPNCMICSDYLTCTGCNDGYYLSASSCVICEFPCKFCISPTVCKTCVPSSPQRNLNDCSCEPIGYYDDGTTDQCQSCTPPCNSCLTPGDICLSCLPTYLYNGVSVCKTCGVWKPNCKTCTDYITCSICNPGFYLSAGSCVQCIFPCTKCTSAEVCTICVVSTPNRIPGTCSCDINGYYDDEITPQCQSCVSPCANCYSQSACTTCIPEHFLSEALTCIPCNYKCLTCDNTSTCLTCKPNRDEVNACQCKIGWFEDTGNSNICTQCDAFCSSCTTLYVCQSCVDPNKELAPTCKYCKTTYVTSPSGCQCPLNFIEDPENEICLDCNVDCTSCIPGHDGTNPVAVCQGCKVIGHDKTTDCSTCIVGYYMPLGNSGCADCQTPFPNCAQCDESACSLCIDTYYIQSGQTQCSLCNIDYPNCELCDKIQCTSCGIGFELQADFTCTAVVDDQDEDEDGNQDGELFLEVIIKECDPQSPEMVDKNCQRCDIADGSCTSCSGKFKRTLNNGQCTCDVMYENNGNQQMCVQQEGYMKQEEMKTTVAVLGSSAGTAAVTGLLFLHPALVLQLLDTLQQIGYILYLQIEYPFLVQEYFKLFEMFDFESIGQIVADNKYHMDSPKGFSDQGVDSLLIRNASQYIVLTLIIFTIYLILKTPQVLLWPSKEGGSIPAKIFLKIVGFFEYQILLGGMCACYLNFTVFCYLQLGSSGPDNITQACSMILAYFALIGMTALPFAILYIAKNVVGISKNIKSIKDKTKMLEKEKEEQGDENSKLSQKLKNNTKKLEIQTELLAVQEDKFGVMFNEFKLDNIMQAGYFGIIGFRKVYFAFNLVVLNNFPALNLSLFLIMNSLTVAYLIMKRPHAFLVHQIRDLITETCFFIIFAASYPLLGNPNEDTKIKVSLAIISAITIILAVELISLFIDYILMVYEIVRQVVRAIKKQKSKRKLTETEPIMAKTGSLGSGGSLGSNGISIDESSQQLGNGNQNNIENPSNVQDDDDSNANFDQFT